MSNNILRVKGVVTIEPLGDDGNVISKSEHTNNMLDLGLINICNYLTGRPTVGFPTHIAAGDNGSPTTGDMLQLVNEITRGEVQENRVEDGINVYYYSQLIGPAPHDFYVREVGLFNAASGGDMFSRVLVTPPLFVREATYVKTTWRIFFQNTSN